MHQGNDGRKLQRLFFLRPKRLCAHCSPSHIPMRKGISATGYESGFATIGDFVVGKFSCSDAEESELQLIYVDVFFIVCTFV